MAPVPREKKKKKSKKKVIVGDDLGVCCQIP